MGENCKTSERRHRGVERTCEAGSWKVRVSRRTWDKLTDLV
jgi:hypothetical protein